MESAMSSPPTDRRVRRTRELLRNALLALIVEKGYDRITVQDILDRADVGRSTFYAHYRDKEDLLTSGFEDIRAALAAEKHAGEHQPGGKVEFLQPLLSVFRHVEAYRNNWGPLTRKGGSDVVARILRQHVAALVEQHLRSQYPAATTSTTQFDAATNYVVGACMGLLIWWLDNDDVTYTADDIHSTFRRLTTQGAKRFIATT
jgi:AcrR family transcriptional regulator